MNLTHAHNQWAFRPADERFKSMGELKAAVAARKTEGETEEVFFRDLRLESNKDRLHLFAGNRETSLTNWSFSQLCSDVGAPADYLRKLSPELAAKNFNYGRDQFLKAAGGGHEKDLELGRGIRRQLLLRQHPGTGLPTLRAATGPDYGRIWDLDVVESVEKVNDDTGNHFINPKAIDMENGGEVPAGLYASDRDCFIFMIDGGSFLDAGPRAKINRGFFCWNSEVGKSSFGLATFLHNGVCGNHICYGVSNLEELWIRHGAGGPEAFFKYAIPKLREFTNASSRNEERVIRKAQELLLPKDLNKDENLAKRWLQKRGFTQKEGIAAHQYATREEGEFRTVWQAVQGLTATARDIPYMDKRVDLERRAGKFLSAMVN